MANDGLLMNFSIEDGIIRPNPVFRGGRWKDRLSARKNAEYRLKKLQIAKETNPTLQAKATHGLSPEDPTTTRFSKRQKVTDTAILRSNFPPEIVSSLFSSNPTSKPPPQSRSHGIIPLAPSNAPLPNSLHTFTSLGLSPQLATHLLTKLSVRSPTAIQKSAISQLLSEDSDAFLQAETGSGKTLAYLLPIVQRIMGLSYERSDATANESTSPVPAESRQRHVHRSSGLFAIILAPTRELCKQISAVLDNILRCVHWIVAGTVIGGEKKKSEKARLRKGLNILVATPGRLADHLENTEVLDVSRVRWLVLDEGDRLMELGFEEEIKGIVKKLEEQKHRVGRSAMGVRIMPRLPERRTTVMCSATMKMNVQRLGEISLKDAVHIKAEPQPLSGEQPMEETKEAEDFSVPTQLKQSYAIVPAKQRLVTLAALLKRTFASRGSVMKVIVFLSCADSVDFHFEVFARDLPVIEPHTLNPPLRESISKGTKTSFQTTVQPPQSPLPTVSQSATLSNPLNPQLTVHKLHGSLAQPLRTATLSAFTRSQHPCILLCTDVASRGLDLPNIDLVIEYDPSFSSDDHLHRVGRTARAGRDGRAVIFLMPGGEEGYVSILEKGYRNGMEQRLVRIEVEETLKKGFEAEVANASVNVGEVTSRRIWEERATEWQLEVERWVIEDMSAGEMARRAFVSHVRAYATHVSGEREMFDVKGLHLGHLAKAFALRDRPSNMGRWSTADGKGPRRSKARMKTMIDNDERPGKVETRWANSDLQVPLQHSQDAVRRMKAKMEEHMAVASEFNIG
ncbi:ATP-dependent RNA helicase dbp7 [Pseudocyphellaria aurata]|nr:ATP-dependent RNA helicase dbp7 [Pseudocyphellaria aurata]